MKKIIKDSNRRLIVSTKVFTARHAAGMSYLEVVLSLAILSIFMLPALAMIVHINNLNDMAYRKSLSYHLGASLITTIAATLYETENFAQVSSYNLFSLTRLSQDEFENRFRYDIFTYSVRITIDETEFYITNVAPLGFTTSFLEIQAAPDDPAPIPIVEIYIELYIRDKQDNIIQQLSRRMPLVR
ncbi:MAG: hypothetical protein FWE02_02765 [Defluviitaleaceae bacterium]|nr:hypothetical protein [Defluviitaleaceae bacterium]